MTKTPIAGDRFQRVRGRVTEVEDAPRSVVQARKTFALVPGNDRSLKAAMSGDGRRHGPGLCLALAQERHSLIEELATPRRSLLHRLAPAGGEFALRQRLQRVRIDDDQARLMESA